MSSFRSSLVSVEAGSRQGRVLLVMGMLPSSGSGSSGHESGNGEYPSCRQAGGLWAKL